MTTFRKSLVAALVLAAGVLAASAAELSGGAIVTRTPLRNAPAKFAATGKGTVAFLGGSITEGNYYRPIVANNLQSRFSGTQFTFLAAGLSSTCSTCGAFRFSEDILSKGTPDVLFVEFAVNDDQDAHFTNEICRRGMEGVIRQARRANPKMDIVMILFTNKNELDLVAANQLPIPYAAHLAVAEHYGVPTVNIAKALVNSTAAGTFTWQDYGADCHPNAAGAQFGADRVADLLDAEGWGSTTATAADYPMPEKLDAGCYDYAHWVSPLRCVRDAKFNYSIPNWSQLTSCRANYSSQPILWSTTPGSTFTLKFKGTDFGAFVLAGSDSGMLEISIDGDAYTTHDLYDVQYSRSLQLPYARVFREGLTDAEHTATCRVSASHNAQSTGTGVRLFRVGVNGADDLTRSPSRASASGITWQDPQPIQGDSDVDTTGFFRYAWGTLNGTTSANQDYLTVNGVTFNTMVRAAYDVRGLDLLVNNFSNTVRNTSWAGGVSSTASLSTTYRNLIGNGFYYSNPPYGDAITLRRLVPGREYLVQIWCSRGTAAAANEKMLIDGTVEVATSGSSTGAGQYVKGTFRAKSDTQSFTIEGEGGYACFNAIQVRDLSPAAKIDWEQAKNVVADTDVRTEGVLRYAYGGSDATVNGVNFKAGMSGGNIGPGTTELYLADAAVTALGSYNWNNIFKAASLPSGCSAGYRSLIDGCCFGGFYVTGYLTLKHLIPGHRYLVQFWINDSRSSPGDVRYLRPDDGPEVSYRTGNGIGQHCTGTFTAVGDEQRIALIPYSRTTLQSGSQLNSFQLRDLTPGIIAWEPPQTITADSDVRTDGVGLYAYSFGQAAATINGVNFANLDGTRLRHGATISIDGGWGINTSAFGAAASGDVTAAYTQITRGSAYNNDGGEMGITLKGLVPGARYLVQLWVNDSRAVGPDRYDILDGGTRLRFRASSTYGQYAVGTFTATGTTHTFSLYGRFHWTSANYIGTTQLNAIQVRRLDSPGTAIEWHKYEISTSDSDVRTDGSLLYAYNFCGSAQTINGVDFAAANTAPGGVTFSNFMAGGYTGFLPSANDVSFGASAGYKNLIGTAHYTNNTPPPTTMTLCQLVPGHRYLVQLWVSDCREHPGYDRYMVVDDAVTLNFARKVDGTANTRAPADYAIGFFTATATTKAVILKAGTYTSVAAASQVNGLQVRDLGVDSSLNVWAGGASGAWSTGGENWQDSAGASRAGTTLWDAENGVANSAYFGAAATALPSADLTAAGIVSAGALTIGAANDGRAVALGSIVAPTLNVNSAWAGETLIKSDAGTWQINGACANLKRVVAGKGSLTFNSELPEGVDVAIAKSATLAPATGSTPVFSRLTGEGTLDFDGTLEINGSIPGIFNGAFDGAVTVRKTGTGAFIFGGTATGSTSIDLREGELYLAGSTPVAITMAEGTVVGLMGGTRSLGTITGAGALRDGTVNGTLTLDGNFTAEGLDLDGDDGLVLLNTAKLAFTGDADLGSVPVTVAKPSQLRRAGAFLSVTGEFIGEPTFAYGEKGYSARLTEDGRGYEIAYTGTLVIFIR